MKKRTDILWMLWALIFVISISFQYYAGSVTFTVGEYCIFIMLTAFFINYLMKGKD